MASQLVHFLPKLSVGSSLDDINKVDSKRSEHLWTNATWQASEEEWYMAHGTLQHDLTLLGKLIPIGHAATEFEQVRETLYSVIQYC